MLRRARGFTLIEFMIAATLSLLILAALTSAFVSSSRARNELERNSQQIENGRYAIQVLSDDFEMAGYWAQYDIAIATPPLPASKPDPCSTNLATIEAAMPLSIQGYDGGTASLTCVTDWKPGTDIVVIRRAASCTAGSTNCAAITGAYYFQASLCSSGAELQSTTYTDFYRLKVYNGSVSGSGFGRHLRDCTTLADIRQFVTRIYYVANNDTAGDGIPTLKRVELGASGGSPAFGAPIAVAEGVEDMQLEYGIDTSPATAPDGAPDVFTTDPDGYTAAGPTSGACPNSNPTANWCNTMAVKINLLVRNPTISPDFTDTKTYVLGSGAPYTPGDHYKRHVYNAMARLNNPARRRES